MTAKTLIFSWVMTRRTSVVPDVHEQLYVQTARLPTMYRFSVEMRASGLPKPLLSRNSVSPWRPSK